jgi:hypothetical protein
MPKGSKPGERRGGRQRGTPNKKTLLRNAEIKAISGKPDLTPLDYFLGVMQNHALSRDDPRAGSSQGAATTSRQTQGR